MTATSHAQPLHSSALLRAVAAQDVREAMGPLNLQDQVAVLLDVLAERGRASGQPALFLALVQQTMRERIGVVG